VILNDVDNVDGRVRYYLIEGTRSNTITAAAVQTGYDKYTKDIDAVLKAFKFNGK